MNAHISSAQHDLISDKRMTANLLCITQLITNSNSLDEGNPIDAIYIDLLKAFH